MRRLAPVAITREYAAELSALAALVDAGLVVMRHEAGCSCWGTRRLTSACVRLTLGTQIGVMGQTGR